MSNLQPMLFVRFWKVSIFNVALIELSTPRYTTKQSIEQTVLLTHNSICAKLNTVFDQSP